jgi:hypothetical protein
MNAGKMKAMRILRSLDTGVSIDGSDTVIRKVYQFL